MSGNANPDESPLVRRIGGHLREVVEYLQGESAGGAITIRRRILETVRRVGQMPWSGRIGRIEGTREAVVPRTPYIVVYQVAEETIEILGIWHGAASGPNLSRTA